MPRIDQLYPRTCWRFINRLVIGILLVTGTIARAANESAKQDSPRADVHAARNADWPVYRHDVALTGTTTAKGKITSPQVKWEYYLGIPPADLVSVDAPVSGDSIDLDGDGIPERYVIDDKTIRVLGVRGEVLWTYTVNGLPLGGNVRVVKLLPERKGLQILSFSGRMDTGEGQGYLFAFDKGSKAGELVWTTGPLTGQHSPTLIIDDMDGDGLPDIVVAPHYRVQIFNGQTGKLKAEVPWDVGRNYGVLFTRPLENSKYKDIFVICDFMPHVDCIGYRDGAWRHVWGHKYVDPSAPTPQGREKYIRVGPHPLVHTENNGRNGVAYMYTDASVGDSWHLHVRAVDKGDLMADIPGIWVWSIADLTGQGPTEIIYTPTRNKRPDDYCELRIAHLRGNQLVDVAGLEHVRPLLTNAELPLTVHTIADEGQRDLVFTKTDKNLPSAFFVAVKSNRGNFPDTIRAVRLDTGNGNKVTVTWEFSRPDHYLNLLEMRSGQNGAPTIRVRDLTAGETVTLDGHANIVRAEAAGRVPGFVTIPIVADLDRDGRNEIIVQNAIREIVALRMPPHANEAATILWKTPGVAMSPSGGYIFNGPLCPQASDMDGDGYPEVLFARESEHGLSELVCADGRTGRAKWHTEVDGASWGGLQAGIDVWTCGHFLGKANRLDVLMALHRRSKNSNEGWLLRGDTGEIVWKQAGLAADSNAAMPFGGELPAVVDINADGVDDLIVASMVIYAAIDGKTAKPLYPPTFMPGLHGFGKWIAYASPTAADLDGDGICDVYLNSKSYARGGYAACRRDGKPMWVEFHDNLEGSNGFGPVGDFDGDGHVEIGVPVLNGTLLCLNAADGKPKWKIKAPVTGDVVAADINGDGTMELIFAGRDEHLHAVSGRDGHEVWSIAAGGQPVIADVDGDGFTEILLVGGDGVLRVVGQKD